MSQDKRTGAAIRTMPADRAMDCLIAERVFGYTLDYEFADLYNGPLINEIYTEDEGSAIVPDYSQHIDSAWQVVEEMGKEGWVIALYRDPDTLQYFAAFSQGASPGGFWSASPSEAICRAALLAVLT